jgi:lipopolysaccharide biosynthesis glycosyltransferase
MRTIDVAFCFDENMWMQAGVAITSLLLNSKGTCCYNIYCVIPMSVNLPSRTELNSLVKEFDSLSSMIFLEANDDFNDSYLGGYHIGIYYRMMLPKLLGLEKIIYFDADTIFLSNLMEIDDIDVKGCYIAGVKDIVNTKSYWKRLQSGNSDETLFGNYINSGFLILNLTMIRENGLYERWIAISKSKKYKYPDQDIFNSTCKGKILHLPMRYNFIVWTADEYTEPLSEGVYSYEEYARASFAPLVLHYCPGKPWKVNIHMGEKWWFYARKTPFYETIALKLLSPVPTKRIIKTGLLFSFIKILTVKEDEKNIKYYLFGFIPIYRVRIKKLF